MDVGFGFWVVVGVVCGEGVISGREFWDGEFALFIGFGVYGLVGFYRVFGVFECGYDWTRLARCPECGGVRSATS